MATLAFAVLAKSIGANAFWGGVLAMAGGFIDNKLFGPKAPNGPRLDSLKIQTSTYGNAIAKCYGVGSKVAGNIIWGTKFVEHKEKAGGKGGGGTTYTYTVSFAIGLCRGPIVGVKRIWTDGTAFPLYESKYKTAGTDRKKLKFSAVDSVAASVWTLTTKTVGESQVLGVKDADDVEYADCAFGTYYDNDLVSFTVDKKTESTVIPDGSVITLTVQPHEALYTFQLHLGTEAQTADSIIEAVEGAGNVPAYRGLAYIVFQDFPLHDFGWRIPNLTFEVECVPADLRDIVEDICINVAGVTLDDIDASDLEGVTVPGYTVESTSNARAQIEPLQGGYNFDGVERDGKIYFERRSVANAVAIPCDDLGAYEGDEPIPPLTITTADEMELPRSVTVKYISPDWDYQEQQMTSKRQLTASRHEVEINTGLIMTDAQAQELADLKLYEAWIQSTSYETALGPKYADIRPGSIIQPVDELGSTHTAVVVKSDYGKPGLNKISAVAISGVVYLPAARTIDANSSLDDSEAATQIIFEFLDLPHLPTDATATDNIYFGCCGNVYSGVNVYKTVDSGNSYQLVKQHVPAATMGVSISTLAMVADTTVWDNTNTVDVTMYNGTLASHTEAEVLAGFNAAMLGDEVIQFKTATLLSAGVYRLSGLLRGRHGTAAEVSTHTSDDRFVLIEASTLGIIPTTDFGNAVAYRVGPVTKPVDDLTYENITFTYTQAAATMLTETGTKSIVTPGWTAFTFAEAFTAVPTFFASCTTVGGVVYWRSVTATGFEALVQRALDGVDIAGDFTYQAQGW
ncbi:MAG: phage tail protein [Negativicutes bacterium]